MSFLDVFYNCSSTPNSAHDPERTEKKTLTRCQHLVVEPLDPKGHVSIYSSTPSLKNSITVVKCTKGTQLILHLFCKSETKQY